MSKKLNKIAAMILSITLIFQQAGFAQVAAQLDLSSHFARIGAGMATDKFRPVHLRYLQYLPQDNSFKLLLDKGSVVDPSLRGASQSRITKQSQNQIASLTAFARNDELRAEPQDLQSTIQDLMKYFYIGLTLPNDTFWVNLRPDSPDNIIDQDLAKTDLGKILLESDLQLKKDTAQFTSPQSIEGKEYWSKLYKKAAELFGSDQITIPTLTRPWIVPGEIIIRETTDSAYIYKATLKVMLEEDYLKMQNSSLRIPVGGEAISKDYSFNDPRLKELNKYSTELIKELIIPKLTKEINSSKRYASLRQVYYSLIMAQWFKARYKSTYPSLRAPQGRSNLDSNVTNLIDSKNLSNLASKTPWDKSTYFQAYKKSFSQGEYNFKEQVYGTTGQTMRSYVSGGMTLDASSAIIQAETTQRPGFTFLSAGSPIGAAGSNIVGAISLPATPNYKEMFFKKLAGIEKERRISSGKVSNALRILKPGDKVTIIIMEARLLTKDGMPKQEKDQIEGRVTKNEPDFSYFGNDYSFPRGRLTIDGISFPYSQITNLTIKGQSSIDSGVLEVGQDSPVGSFKQPATAASPVSVTDWLEGLKAGDYVEMIIERGGERFGVKGTVYYVNEEDNRRNTIAIGEPPRFVNHKRYHYYEVKKGETIRKASSTVQARRPRSPKIEWKTATSQILARLKSGQKVGVRYDISGSSNEVTGVVRDNRVSERILVVSEVPSGAKYSNNYSDIKEIAIISSSAVAASNHTAIANIFKNAADFSGSISEKVSSSSVETIAFIDETNSNSRDWTTSVLSNTFIVVDYDSSDDFDAVVMRLGGSLDLRSKVAEIKKHAPQKPIVLVGMDYEYHKPNSFIGIGADFLVTITDTNVEDTLDEIIGRALEGRGGYGYTVVNISNKSASPAEQVSSALTVQFRSYFNALRQSFKATNNDILIKRAMDNILDHGKVEMNNTELKALEDFLRDVLAADNKFRSLAEDLLSKLQNDDKYSDYFVGHSGAASPVSKEANALKPGDVIVVNTPGYVYAHGRTSSLNKWLPTGTKLKVLSFGEGQVASESVKWINVKVLWSPTGALLNEKGWTRADLLDYKKDNNTVSSALASRLVNLNPGGYLKLTVNQELSKGVSNTYVVKGVLTDNSPDFETLVIQTDGHNNSPATIDYEDVLELEVAASSSVTEEQLKAVREGDHIKVNIQRANTYKQYHNRPFDYFDDEGIVVGNNDSFNTRDEISIKSHGQVRRYAYHEITELTMVSSSAVKKDDSFGGIDFRALPIVSYASSALKINIANSPIAKLDNISLSKEVLAIQKMLEAGIAPSEERIKDFVQASSVLETGNLGEARQKAVLWIAEVLRRQEEECCASSAILKDILVVLDSGVSEKELRAIFSGKG